MLVYQRVIPQSKPLKIMGAGTTGITDQPLRTLFRRWWKRRTMCWESSERGFSSALVETKYARDWVKTCFPVEFSPFIWIIFFWGATCRFGVPKIFRCQDSQWGDPTIKSWWEKQTGNGVYHQWWLFHRGKWMIMMIHPQKLGYPTFRPKNCNSVSCVNNWLHPNSARSSLSLSFLSVQARIWWDGGTENSESPTVLDEKLMDIIYFSNYLGQPRVPWRNWYRTNRHPGQEQHTRSDWKSSKMVVFKYETPKRIPWDHLGYPLALRSPPLVFTCFHTLEGYCSHCRFSKNLMLRLSRDWFPSVPSHRIPRHSARWSASLSAESCQMRRERRNPWWPILGSTSRPSLLGSPGGMLPLMLLMLMTGWWFQTFFSFFHNN